MKITLFSCGTCDDEQPNYTPKNIKSEAMGGHGDDL